MKSLFIFSIILSFLISCSYGESKRNIPFNKSDIDHVVIEYHGALQGTLSVEITGPDDISNLHKAVSIIDFNNPLPYFLDYNVMYRLVFIDKKKDSWYIDVLYDFAGWTYQGKDYDLDSNSETLLRTTIPTKY